MTYILYMDVQGWGQGFGCGGAEEGAKFIEKIFFPPFLPPSLPPRGSGGNTPGKILGFYFAVGEF